MSYIYIYIHIYTYIYIHIYIHIYIYKYIFIYIFIYSADSMYYTTYLMINPSVYSIYYYTKQTTSMNQYMYELPRLHSTRNPEPSTGVRSSRDLRASQKRSFKENLQRPWLPVQSDRKPQTVHQTSDFALSKGSLATNLQASLCNVHTWNASQTFKI